MRKIITAVIFMLAITASAVAAGNPKWETMSFTDDISGCIEALKTYCQTNDLKLEDVLWANKTDESSLKAGMTLFLPKNRADMLAIWQRTGAWQPTALVPVVSEATARRAVKSAEPARKEVAKDEVIAESPAPAQTQAIAQTPKAKDELLVASSPKAKKSRAKKKQAEAEQSQAIAQATEEKTQLQAKSRAKKQPETEQSQAIAQLPKENTELQADLDLKTVQAVDSTKSRAKKQPEADPVQTPAPAPKSTAKPDKILAANKKSSNQDIPGLMDPIIILSPNGDPTNGPMRLIISGDKVEVVKLPQNAMPKKPTVTDASAPFTSSYSYLPYYDLTGRQRSNIMTNLNNFTSLNGKMMWPVDGRISSPFGKWRGKHKHEGIDIPMPEGTPIRAAKNGVVIRTGNNSTMGFRGYGNFVMLDHGGGVRTFYAHCQRVAVQPGQRIMQGQIIGYVGNTGRSTASHLHFEVRINDTKVNPVPYLAGNTHLASHK